MRILDGKITSVLVASYIKPLNSLHSSTSKTHSLPGRYKTQVTGHRTQVIVLPIGFDQFKDRIHKWRPGGGGGVLPYMGHIGMCRCEGYGFQAVYSSLGYINQSVWV